MPFTALITPLPERNKIPISASGHRRYMTENIEIPIMRTKLEEHVFRTVPLVHHFLHPIFVLVQPEADWPFIRLPSRITIDLQIH